ncbi:MAG: prepilin peptidase [Holdemanella sp.]|nr:prepilin peptidase [Holdemanella sp.]
MKNFFIGYILCYILSIPFLVNDHLFYTFLLGFFLYSMAYKDYRSYYIHPLCIPISIVFLVVQPYHPPFSFLSLLFGFVGIYFYSKQSMGSMDLYFLFYFGIYLGYERMIVSIFISIVIGCIFLLIKKEKLIPFITCLSIGVWISLLRGYTLFEAWIHIQF